MKEIKASITINAPIDKVWQVLTDFNTWNEWNESVLSAEGSAEVGSRLTITMRKGQNDQMNYHPTVVESEPPNRFRWRAKMGAGFIFTNDRIFELKDNGGSTEFTNIEAFSGIMASMSWKKMQQFVPNVLNKMNEALKERVES